MSDKIKWEKFQILIENISKRPYQFNQSSDFEISQNFSLKPNGLSGEKLDEMGIDSQSLISEEFNSKSPADHLLLYSALQKIIGLDLFEHEGDDNFTEIIQEICNSIDTGYFIWKNITCYDEADMCILKLENKKCSFITLDNPYYED